MNRFSAFLIAMSAFAVTSITLLSTNGGAGQVARAQALADHDSSAPVSYAADHFELQQRSDHAIFWGNVRVEQAGLVMTAQRLTVSYSRNNGTEINRINVTGNVTVKKGNETARGNIAVYDLNRRLITLIGDVELHQGPNHINGARLLIDLNNGRATIDGQGAERTPDGQLATGKTNKRVQGQFNVSSNESLTGSLTAPSEPD